MLRKFGFVKVAFLIFACFFTSSSCIASHLMGADMTYTSLGGGKYKITANVYRDCRSISLSTPTFGVFAGTAGGNGCGSYTLSISRTSISEVTGLCRKGAAKCKPQNNIAGQGIEKHVYEATVDFGTTPLSNFVGKSSCCEVTFYVESCCRSGAINTGPASQDFYGLCTINLCNLSKCSNKEAMGARITSPPPTSICCNQPYYYNYGFIDTLDNDSLSYNLVPPVQGLPKTSVTYTSPYTYKKPAFPFCVPSGVTCTPQPYAATPRGFFFDTTNADLIYTPTKCDQVAVIAVEGKEWRRDTSGNYVWVGKVRSDIMHWINDACGYNNTIRLDSQYNFSVCAGDKIEFRINVTDYAFTPFQSKPDTMVMGWNGAIPGATFKVLSDTFPGKETAIFSWQTKKSDVRGFKYHFTFWTSDSVCPYPIITYRAVNITLKQEDTSWFSSKRVNCNSLELTAGVGSKSSGTNTYTWTIRDSITNKLIYTGTGNPITTKQLPGATLKINLHIENKLFCFPDVVHYLKFDSLVPVLKLPNDTTICKFSAFTSASTLSQATSPIKYNWKINGVASGKDTFPDITLKNIVANQKLELTIIDKNTCSAMASHNVILYGDSIIYWSPKTITVCHDTGDILLDKYVNLGDSANAIFWCKTPAYFKKAGNDNYFMTGKTDNVALQSGVVESVRVYASFTSYHGCFTKDSMTIRVNGSPIVELKTKNLCQDIGMVTTDSFKISPKSKFGITEYWKVLTAPSGVNKSTLLTKSSGVLWYFNFGTKTDTVYGGNYDLELRVVNNTTGCYSRDTGLVNVVNEARYAYTSEPVCDNVADFSLVNNGTLDNIPVGAPPKTTYKIRSFNYKTTDPKVTATTLKNGYLFPATAGAGHWTFNFTGSAYGCPVSDTFGFQVMDAPVAAFTTTPKDTTTTNSPVFNVTNSTAINGGASLTYFWNFGTGKASDTSVATNPTITFPAVQAGYNVMLIAKASNGCRDTVYMKLQVIKGTTGLHLPELNNAWLDNYFRLSGVEFRTCETHIYDASGRLLSSFENNIGADLPAGIYYYQINVLLQNGKQSVLKGSVQIQK